MLYSVCSACGRIKLLTVLFRSPDACVYILMRASNFNRSYTEKFLATFSTRYYKIDVDIPAYRHRRRSGWNSEGSHGGRQRWVGAEWGGVW